MSILKYIKKERTIWIILLAIVLVCSTLVIWDCKSKLNSAEQRISNLEEEKNALAQMENDLSTQAEGMKSRLDELDKVIKSLPRVDDAMIYQLRQSGFNGDVNEIVEDLMKHSELIPYEGVLGGRMGFYFKDKIYVLSDKWVLAYFEDGHINGYMLLGYKYNSGRFTWKVIDSYLLGGN